MKPLDEWRCVDCAGCGKVLLGESERAAADVLTPLERSGLPPVMAGRRNDRPYCRWCLSAEEKSHDEVKARAAVPGAYWDAGETAG